MVGRPRGNVVSSPDVGQDSVAQNAGGSELGGRQISDHQGTPWLTGLVELLTRYGERAGDALVYSSAYLAFIAMVQVAIVMVLLSLPPSLAPIVVGLVTFSVYASDRLEDVDSDAKTHPQRAAFIRRHKGWLSVLAAISYGLAVAFSVLGGPLALAITILPGVFWVLYATDWISDVGIHVRRLKELFIVNSAVVAIAWAVTLTFLPIAFAGVQTTPVAAVVFGYFFLGTFVNAEIPNVRDMDGDRQIGVRTMPIAFGVRRTRQALYGIDLLMVGIVGYAVLNGYLTVDLATALLVGLIYSVGVTYFLGRYENNRLLTIAAESEYVFVALALVPVVYLA